MEILDIIFYTLTDKVSVKKEVYNEENDNSIYNNDYWFVLWVRT